MSENTNFPTTISDDDDDNVTTFDYRKGVKNLTDNSPNLKKLPAEFILPLEGNPLSAGYAQIPIIDLSGLNGDSETRISTVQAIASASQHWGIFTITNHGIEEELMEEMMNVCKEFFCLDVKEKMRYASDDVMCPVRYGTSLNTSKKHNLHWRDFFRHYGHPFQDTLHLWPINPPNYRKVAREYLEQIRKMMMKIAGAISEGIGLENGLIAESLGEGVQILAANYYPPCPEPEKTLGLAAHSDHGGLTILTQNGVDGLQIKRDQTWVSVHHLPGTFLVNIGDYLEMEVDFLMKTYEDFIRSDVKELISRLGIRFSVIGDKSRLSESMQAAISEAENLSHDNKGMHLILAISYGGRNEIVEAVKKIARKVEDGIVEAKEIDESMMEQHLMSHVAEYPNLDLLIRPGGEVRVSNFMLWQMSYAELYFTDTLFPDFGEAAILEALAAYSSRNRRYGLRSS